MVNVSIKDFARSGQFGPIDLGISRDSLRTLLGHPDEWGVHPKSVEEAGIWKYGDIEFYFDETNILYMIFADNFGVLDGGDNISFDPWIVRMNIDDSSFKDALESSGIVYTIATVLHLPTHVDIKTIGDVEFRFQVETEDEYDRLGLQGFWLRQNAA